MARCGSDSCSRLSSRRWSPKRTVARLLGRDDVRSVALATGIGAASSSRSYAAVTVARSRWTDRPGRRRRRGQTQRRWLGQR